MRLSELKKGETATVIKISTDKKEKDKLMEMGLIEGVKITMVRKSVFNSPIQFKVRDFYLAIREKTAQMITVEL